MWLLSEVIKYIKVSSCQGHVKFWILVSALTTGTSTKLSAGEEALMEQLCTKSAALSPRDEKVFLGGSAPALLRPGEDRTKSTPWTNTTQLHRFQVFTAAFKAALNHTKFKINQNQRMCLLFCPTLCRALTRPSCLSCAKILLQITPAGSPVHEACSLYCK